MGAGGREFENVANRKSSATRKSDYWQAWIVGLLQIVACGKGPATGSSPARTEQAPQQPRATGSNGLSSRYDLERDERRGGHTLKKHVGRTDEQLRERLQRERNISAASTWTDRETAEGTVAQVLRANERRMESWMRRGFPRANLALRYDAGHAVGRCLQRGTEQPVDCSRAVIVLRADGPDTFYVLTTYPEARE